MSETFVENQVNCLNQNPSETLSLGVEIMEKDMPEGWDGLVCIHGICFNGIPRCRRISNYGCYHRGRIRLCKINYCPHGYSRKRLIESKSI